ncbi:MAG: efflux RND transporter periplasmic adaptor subunit [Gemmatimonadota bacterium]
MSKWTSITAALLTVATLAACGKDDVPAPAGQPVTSGARVAVIDSVIVDAYEAAGTAEPLRLATLSTKLMGTVNFVSVQEGDRVVTGQTLIRLDARDLDARRAQVEAGMASASAVQRESAAQATRIRALFADSAATRAQLDQAESGLARAEAAVASATAMASELAATASYAEVRAPFAGIVTRRFVDPGSFASPGAPLATVEDASSLRIAVSAAPDAVRELRRGAKVTAVIGDSTVQAVVEGVVPAGTNLYTINALVPNPKGHFLSGSAATLALPRGTRHAILVPAGAVIRQGELTGVRTVKGSDTSLRWVKLGRPVGNAVEILSGLAIGDTVLVGGGGS